MTFFQSHRNKLTPDANLVVHTEISKEYKRNFSMRSALCSCTCEWATGAANNIYANAITLIYFTTV